MLPMMILSGFFIFKERFSISEISRDEELIAEVEKMVTEPSVPAEEEQS
jgi:hypothetical protein